MMSFIKVDCLGQSFLSLNGAIVSVNEEQVILKKVDRILSAKIRWVGLYGPNMVALEASPKLLAVEEVVKCNWWRSRFGRGNIFICWVCQQIITITSRVHMH